MAGAVVGAGSLQRNDSISHVLWLLREFDEDDEYVLCAWDAATSPARDAAALKGVMHAACDVMDTLSSRPSLSMTFQWGDDDSWATAWFAVAADSLVIVIADGLPPLATGITLLAGVLEIMCAVLGGIHSVHDRFCSADGTPQRSQLESHLSPAFSQYRAEMLQGPTRGLSIPLRADLTLLDASAASLCHTVGWNYHGAHHMHAAASTCTYTTSPAMTGVGRAMAAVAWSAPPTARALVVPPPFAAVQASIRASAAAHAVVHSSASRPEACIASALAELIADAHVTWTRACLSYVPLYAATRGGVDAACDDTAMACAHGTCSHANAGHSEGIIFVNCAHKTAEGVDTVMLCIGAPAENKSAALSRATAIAASGDDRERAVTARLVVHASTLLLPQVDASPTVVTPVK